MWTITVSWAPQHLYNLLVTCLPLLKRQEAEPHISPTPLQLGSSMRSSFCQADITTQNSKVKVNIVGSGHVEGAQISWKETISHSSRNFLESSFHSYRFQMTEDNTRCVFFKWRWSRRRVGLNTHHRERITWTAKWALPLGVYCRFHNGIWHCALPRIAPNKYLD